MKHYLQNDSSNGIRELVSHYELCTETKCFDLFDESDFLLIAEHYDQEKFPKEAIRTINIGVATFPRSRSLKTLQIRLLIKQDHPNLALEVLQKENCKSLSPADIDLLTVEGMIRIGNYKKSLNRLVQMKVQYHLAKTRSDIFVLEAMIYEKQKRFDLVFIAINEALHYSPTHENALVRMLFCVEFSKKHKESIQFHKQLLQREHYSALTWYNLGISFYHEFLYEEAIEAFEFANIIDSKLEAAYYFCGEVYMFRGIYTKAIAVYDEMMENCNVTKPEVYINLAECLIKTGSSEQAIPYLKFALLLDEDPDILYWMAEANRILKKYDDAFKYYYMALEWDDTREDIHIQLATLFFEQCEFEKASKHFQIAVEQAPDVSAHWIAYASLFENIGELEKAEAILNEAKEYNYCPQIIFCQGACLILMGKKKEGIKLIDDALNLDINQQDIIFEFAGQLRTNPNIIAILKYYNEQ